MAAVAAGATAGKSAGAAGTAGCFDGYVACGKPHQATLFAISEAPQLELEPVKPRWPANSRSA